MGNSDHDLFNCSEEYEVDYVVGLYRSVDRPSVRAVINSACENGIIYRWTHKELYDFLELKGYFREKLLTSN